MIRLIRLLLAVIVLVVIVAFVIANRDPVTVSFAPLPVVMELPLYGVFLVGLVFGVLIGGFGVWIGSLMRARENRKLRNKVWALENQISLIRQQEEKAQAERQAASRAVAVPRVAA
jgi:uncharacterized integral membrane protein